MPLLHCLFFNVYVPDAARIQCAFDFNLNFYVHASLIAAMMQSLFCLCHPDSVRVDCAYTNSLSGPCTIGFS